MNGLLKDRRWRGPLALTDDGIARAQIADGAGAFVLASSDGGDYLPPCAGAVHNIREHLWREMEPRLGQVFPFFWVAEVAPPRGTRRAPRPSAPRPAKRAR